MIARISYASLQRLNDALVRHESQFPSGASVGFPVDVLAQAIDVLESKEEPNSTVEVSMAVFKKIESQVGRCKERDVLQANFVTGDVTTDMGRRLVDDAWEVVRATANAKEPLALI